MARKANVTFGLLWLALLIAASTLVSPALTASTDVTENSWTTKSPMPTANGYLAAVVNGKIYVFGNSVNYEYDPATDAWAAKKPLPTPVQSFVVAACQDRIYVIGGNVYPVPTTGINEVYNPATDTWENRTPMPSNRSDMEANVVNGKIYLIGGYADPNKGTTSNLNEVYDPATNSWSMKAPMPYNAVHCASTVVDNKIYVIGGQNIYNWDFNQIYDPATDTWSQGTRIPVSTWQAAAGATTGTMAPKRIYVIGGQGSGMLDFLSRNYVYDPQADSWSVGADLPTPRSNLAVAVVNDLLYAVGGTVGWGTATAAVEQYTPFGYGTVPPAVSVVSPKSNMTYATGNVSLAFTVNKPAQGMSYSLDGQANVTVTGNTTLTGLSSGLHNVTVYAQDTLGNIGASQTIYFSIEPFPTTLIAAAVVIAAAAGAGLIVYFKKYRR